MDKDVKARIGQRRNEQRGAEFMLARQPICDGNERIFAYELLFRDFPSPNHAQVVDETRASAQIVVNSLELGLDRIIGPAQAFINVGRDFILQHRFEFVPRNRVVLEILENTVPDRETIASLKEAVKEGYRFALDDYIDRN